VNQGEATCFNSEGASDWKYLANASLVTFNEIGHAKAKD